MIHKRSTALERSVNILLEGLNQFHGANLAFNSDMDQDTFGKMTKHNKYDSQEVSPFYGSRILQGSVFACKLCNNLSIFLCTLKYFGLIVGCRLGYQHGNVSHIVRFQTDFLDFILAEVLCIILKDFENASPRLHPLFHKP